jgi:hypothetical protein
VVLLDLLHVNFNDLAEIRWWGFLFSVDVLMDISMIMTNCRIIIPTTTYGQVAYNKQI